MFDKQRLLKTMSVAGLTGIALMMVAPGLSMAAKYLSTRQPMRNVGTLDPELSIACQHHTFNQQKVQNLLIGYIGKSGRGITGIATKQYNLRDPQGLARDDMTYHFYNDGYSDCQVYAARYRPPRQN